MTTADNASTKTGAPRRSGRGTPQGPANRPALNVFNRASSHVLLPQLTELSGSDAWARALLDARPFRTIDAMLAAGDDALAHLSRSDLAVAIAAHPALGRAPRRGSASEAEQATLLEALGDDDDGAGELHQLSRQYESRFGHVFLLCARGLDSSAVLAALRARIGNDRDAEWAETVEQLRLINRGRLADLIDGLDEAAA